MLACGSARAPALHVWGKMVFIGTCSVTTALVSAFTKSVVPGSQRTVFACKRSHTHIHICRSGGGRVVLPTHTHAHTFALWWGRVVLPTHAHTFALWWGRVVSPTHAHTFALCWGEGCIANARTHGVAVEDMVEAVEARPPECTSLQIRFRSPRCFLVFLSFCQHACRQPGE